LYPRGQPLRHGKKKGANIFGREAVELVNTLAVFHQAGIVHRDVSPANIYLVSSGGRRLVMLNDFGLCVESGANLDVAGTRLYLADELLQAGCTIGAPVPPARPAHDLESLVKVFVQQTYPQFDDDFGSEHLKTHGDVLQRWQELAAGEASVAEGLQLAREANYEGLKAFFKRCVLYSYPLKKQRAAFF
jgi:hypothetical protein